MSDIIRDAKKQIPSLDSIIEEAWQNLKLNSKNVKKKFGQVLINYDIEATRIFRDHEKEALKTLAKSWLRGQGVGSKNN